MDKIREQAEDFFGDVNPAHDWFHVKRVHELALRIAEEENADKEVVEAAVFLHDIGRAKEDHGKINNHAEWGAEKAEKILDNLDYSQEFIEEVKHCINSHRYSTDPDPDTLEAKVLSDADNLDALGATGISRTFTYGGERGSVIADPELPVEDDKSSSGATSVNHLEKKILNLKDRMYTDTGKDIAEERHDYVASFVERFKEEMQGKK